MEILKRYYADYHEEGTGRGLKIVIDRILLDHYIPELEQRGKINYRDIIKQDFIKVHEEIDTCKNISLKIGQLHEKDNWTIAESTRYQYTIKAKLELYGRYEHPGEIGSCKPIYVDAKWQPLSDEQVQKIHEAADEVYGVIELKDREAIDAYWAGELNKYELDEILKANIEVKKDAATYQKYQALCEKKLGFKYHKATLFSDGTIAERVRIS